MICLSQGLRQIGPGDLKVQAFTLVELLIVVAILAILAAVSFSIYRHYFRAAFEVDPVSVLMAAKLAQEEYYADHDHYACRIEDLPGFDDGSPDNKYWLNSDKDDRRRFYLTVANCTEDSYTLRVKNLTDEAEWKIEWKLSCGAAAQIGDCKPEQIKGASTFRNLFN